MPTPYPVNVLICWYRATFVAHATIIFMLEISAEDGSGTMAVANLTEVQRFSFHRTGAIGPQSMAGGGALIAAVALIAGLAFGAHANSRYAGAEPTGLSVTSSRSGVSPAVDTSAVSPVSTSPLLDSPTMAAFAPTAGPRHDIEVRPDAQLPALGDLRIPPDLLDHIRLTLSADGVLNLVRTIAGWGVSATTATINLTSSLLSDLITLSTSSDNGSGTLSVLKSLLTKGSGATAAAATVPKLAPALKVPKVPKVPKLHMHGGIPFVPFI
ncbi:hypothetical protein ACXDF8_04045 [Mycolicibacterium sp. CBM1]